MKKTLPMRLLAMALCVATLAAVTPIFASAESMTYLDYNETTGAVDLEREVEDVNVIDEATDSFVTGWNIVEGNVEFGGRITLPKDVNLILANGATLTAKLGITVATDGDFAVYAQSNNAATMGKLIVPGSVPFYKPGLGSDNGASCGDISIYGGTVTIQGGMYAAGIGSGDTNSACGKVTIYGGVVTAIGGNSGAGIGTGFHSDCGDITIIGGIVTAQGGVNSAGIGSGVYASCNNLTVLGGYVKATAGANSAPIGAGLESTAVEASIDASCTSVIQGSTQYINYKILGKEPTCTESGFKAYFQDPVSGNYYDALPLSEDTLIGDATALAAWKAKGGDGYVVPIPHVDENEDDICDDCEAVFIKYLDYNETTGNVDAVGKVVPDNVIDEATDSFVTGWNVVEGTVEFESRIVLPKDVNLILANGATLTAKKGITVAEDGDFAIYAQSNDAATRGMLVVPNSVEGYKPGIGSDKDKSCGNISVYGGTVVAQGGMYAAGIGGGDSGSSCGALTIYGGMVTAIGGAYGAGIGTGYNSDCGDITIYDGIVTAQGGYEAAGIGSGYYASSCGTVTISGGYVKATSGGEGAETIGAGCDTDAVPVSIDSSCTSEMNDGVQYINYKILGKEPTCTESGFKACFQDPVSGKYYSALPLSEDTLIGDAAALAAWKAKGGAGYIAPLPHTDEDEDNVCDVCTAALTSYLDYNATTGNVDTVRKIVVDNVIDEATDSFVTGWNVVKGDVEFERRIVLPKDVNLILANGATLTADKGIQVAADGDFAVYAQSNDAATMGELLVPNSTNNLCAGIGGSDEAPCGDIAIYGGVVTAQGGMYAAGIGSGLESACGTVTIYGGVVTAIGSSCAAGIGGGYDSACGGVTITGGIVHAQGGENGAGIGSGFSGSCSKVTIKAGYVAAMTGNGAAPIGMGNHSDDVEVSIDSSCTSVLQSGAQYINYEPFATVEPTCTESGLVAYYKDYISGNYYTEFPFAEDGLIGDDTALAAWKAEDGDGYLAELGHDWQYVNDSIHECSRCKSTEEHTGADEDYICDVCDGVLLETAIEDAEDEINTAVGENPSKELSDMAEDILHDLHSSASPAEAISIKNAGLAAINTYLGILADAKTAAKAALADAAGENPSAAVKASLDTACGMIDAANTTEGVAAIKETVLPVITAQVAAETEAAAQTLASAKAAAKAALANAAGEEPSEALATVLSDACDAVDEAATVAAVQTAEEAGFTAIMEQLATEATAKAAAEKQEVEDELAQAEKDLAAANAALEAANDTIDELNDTISALNDTVKSKDATIAEKQAALDTATEQLNAAKADLETAKANLETAKANIEGLEGTVSEQDEALKQAAQDLKDAQDALDEMTENYNETKAALETAQKDLADTTKALDEAKAANEQLQKDLAAANDTIAELNNTMKSKDATIAEKQAALDTATEQLNAAKTDLDKAKADLEAAQAKVTELEGTVSEKDEALAQAAKDLEDAQQTLAQNEQEIKDLQAEIERLKALLDDDPTDPQPAEMLGDANNDGAVNMKDVLLMRKYLADNADAMNMANADCNGDGDVNMKDVLMLRKYLANIIDTLGA